jgi:hypothetical protein
MERAVEQRTVVLPVATRTTGAEIGFCFRCQRYSRVVTGDEDEERCAECGWPRVVAH